MFSESGKITITPYMKYRISFASNLHPFLGRYDSLRFFGKKHIVQKLLPSSGVEGYPTTEKQERGLYGRYYTRYIYLKDNIYNIKVSKVKQKCWTSETMYLVQFSIECNETALKNLIAEIEHLHCNPHTKYKVIG